MATLRHYALVCLGIGLVALGAAIAVEARRAAWRSTARPTTGIVSGLVQNLDRDGGQAPVLSYQVDGEPHQWQSHLYSDPPAYTIGEQVQMLYQPGQPDDAAIDAFMAKHFVGLLAGGIGAVFTAVGVVLFRIDRGSARRRV